MKLLLRHKHKIIILHSFLHITPIHSLLHQSHQTDTILCFFLFVFLFLLQHNRIPLLYPHSHLSPLCHHSHSMQICLIFQPLILIDFKINQVQILLLQYLLNFQLLLLHPLSHPQIFIFLLKLIFLLIIKKTLFCLLLRRLLLFLLLLN